MADIDAKRAMQIADKAKLPKLLEYMKRKQTPTAAVGGMEEHKH